MKTIYNNMFGKIRSIALILACVCGINNVWSESVTISPNNASSWTLTPSDAPISSSGTLNYNAGYFALSNVAIYNTKPLATNAVIRSIVVQYNTGSLGLNSRIHVSFGDAEISSVPEFSIADAIAGPGATTTWEATGAHQYFQIAGTGGTQIKSITINYTTNSHSVAFITNPGTGNIAVRAESSVGSGVSLAGATPTAPAGSTFEGWSPTPVADGTYVKPHLHGTSETFYPTTDCNLYAVYSTNTTVGGDESFTYQLMVNNDRTHVETPLGDNWIVYGSVPSTYYALNTNGAYLQTPILDLSAIQSLSVTMRTVNSVTNKYIVVQNEYGDTIRIETIDNNLKESTASAAQITKIKHSGLGKLKFYSEESGGSIGISVAKVITKPTTIDKYASGAAAPVVVETYWNYAVSCTAYHVTYNSAGGSDVCSDEDDHYVRDLVTVCTATPERTGYTFNGWTSSPSVDVVDGKFSMPASDVEFSAQWTAKTYTITINANGGNENKETTATYDSKTVTSFANPTYTGRTLKGFYTSAADDALMVMSKDHELQPSVDGYTGEGGVWTRDGDATLYAHWETNTQTITYYVNGEVWDVVNVAYGGDASAHADPECPDGKTFMGWSASATTELQQTAIAVTSADGSATNVRTNLTRHAIFASRNGGKATGEETLILTELFNDAEQAISRWECSAASETLQGASMDVATNQNCYLNMDKHNLKPAYIQSQQKIHDVSKVQFKVWGSGGNSTHKYNLQYSVDGTNWVNCWAENQSYQISEAKAEVKEYAFAGVKDAYLRIVTVPGDMASLYKLYIDDIKLYTQPCAWWYSDYSTTCEVAANATLTFDENGGEALDDVVTSVIPTDVILPVAVKSGATFGGWKVTGVSGYVTHVFAADENYVLAHDVTLTAQWSSTAYTLTLDANGGVDDKMVTVTYGSSNISPANFSQTTRTGYTIDGYYTLAEGGEQVIGTDKKLIANIFGYTDEDGNWINTDENPRLYAHWIAAQTTITLNQQGATVDGQTEVVATFEQPMPQLSSLPTKDGASFGGYYQNANGAGTKYYNADGSSATNWDRYGATNTLYAYWTKEQCQVTYHLTNATTSDGPDAVDFGKQLTATIVADGGFALPASISVTIGGEEAVLGTDYTWTRASGKVTVKNTATTANIVITVTAYSTDSHYAWNWGVEDQTGWQQQSFVYSGSGTVWMTDWTFPTHDGSNLDGYVGNPDWWGNNLGVGTNKSKSAHLYFYNIPLVMSRGNAELTKDQDKVGWTHTSDDGDQVIGRLQINDNSGDDNLYVGFLPDGYKLTWGPDAGDWNTLDFSAVDAAQRVWQTEVQEITETEMSYHYYVGMKTASDGVSFTATNSETTTLSSMGAFVSGTWNDAKKPAAGSHGVFRMWANYRENGSSTGTVCNTKNWVCHFVPYYRLTLDLNYPEAEKTYQYFSTEASDTKRKAVWPENPERSGYIFAGWNTTADGSGTWYKTTTSNQSFTVSEDVTLYAIWVGELTVTGDVYLTSANGVNVGTAQDAITLSVAEKAGAASLRITYRDVDKGITYGRSGTPNYVNSEFRLADNSYTYADGSNINLSGSGSYEAHYTMRYTPTEMGLDHYQMIVEVISAGNSNTVLQTVTLDNMSGRYLPDQFVIAAKYNNVWYALPNDMGEAGLYDVLPIVVNSDGEATAPTNAIYRLATYKSSDYEAVRFVTETTGLWGASGTNNGIRDWSKTENAGNYGWVLTTTDMDAYTISPRSSERNLNIYDMKWGLNANVHCNEIHFLPLAAEVTPMTIHTREWKANGLLFSYIDNNISLDATYAIGAGAAVATTLTRHSTGGYGLYEIATCDLTDKAGQTLTINAGGKTAMITIPIIVNENKSTKTSEPFATLGGNTQNYDVVVLPDVTLTTDAIATGACKFNNLYIYPGATLINTANANLSLGYLELRGGIKGIDAKNTREEAVPHLYLDKKISQCRRGANLDMNVDVAHDYGFSVPFAVNVANVNYTGAWSTSTGAPLVGTLGTHFRITHYNGAKRAVDGSTGWVDVNTGTLNPGEGYLMQAKRPSGQPYSVIRFPLASGTTDVEKWINEASAIAITAHGKDNETVGDNNKGWNLIANPYLAKIKYGESDDLSAIEAKLVLATMVKEMVNDRWTGKYVYETTSNPWIYVPNATYSEYAQLRANNVVFEPFRNFFVQAAENGTVTFDRTKRQSAPAYMAAPAAEVAEPVIADYVLSHQGKQVYAGLTIDENATPGYKFGEDQHIFEGNAAINYLKTYMLVDDKNIAGNRLTPREAETLIPVVIYAPDTNGEYQFSIDENSQLDRIQSMLLVDYYTGDVHNLLNGSYTFEVDEAGLIRDRFALNVTLQQSPGVATDVDNIWSRDQQDGTTRVEKIIYEDKLYLIRDGRVYDATGKRVELSK